MRAIGKFEGKHLRNAAVFLWIGVLVAFSFVQVMHTHAALSDPERGHCAICLAVHSPAAMTAAAVLEGVALLQIWVPMFEPELRGSDCFALHYSRPPPSA